MLQGGITVPQSAYAGVRVNDFLGTKGKEKTILPDDEIQRCVGGLRIEYELFERNCQVLICQTSSCVFDH